MRAVRIFLKQAAKSCLMLMAIASVLASMPAAHASAGNGGIKIIAWYGAGNLSKSEYGRDTIILFNPTQASITMTNWSIQTGGTTGSFTTIYKLPTITMPAGSYYAIAGSGPAYISSAGCSSSHCNTNYAYDYQLKTVEGTATTTDNDLSSTAVTVALVSSQTTVGTCPTTAATLVDLVGIGAVDGSSPVTCFAGSSYAPYTPATLNGSATSINGVVYAYATVRNNPCSDTFNNYNDFSLAFIDFKNSSSTPHVCPTGTQLAVAATATPNNPGITETVLVKASVTAATTPASTGLAVTADLSNLGLSSTQPLYDDGTHGDAVAGDKIYSYSAAVASGQVGLVPGVTVTATDTQGDVARSDVALNLAAGTLTLTSTASTAATVSAGDVAKFPLTLGTQHGYGGVVNITCTGSPNTNSLGVPISTQCVATPNEVTVGTNSTATISLAIATGTTFPASVLPKALPLAVLALASMVLLTVAVWRRKHLPLAALVVLVSLMTLNTVACGGTNAGIGNTSAAAGTYTYTVTATDASISTITNSMTLTVTVK